MNGCADAQTTKHRADAGSNDPVDRAAKERAARCEEQSVSTLISRDLQIWLRPNRRTDPRPAPIDFSVNHDITTGQFEPSTRR